MSDDRPLVLLVEDSFALRLSLTTYLRGQGLKIAAAASAEEGALAAAEAPPDVALLDWNLPGESGVSLLRRWRAAGLDWPVILLTARDAIDDRVTGLESGANDYMVKPFANAELLARVRVQLRDRSPPLSGDVLVLGGARVDLARRTVTRGGGAEPKRVRLTTREAELLAWLAARPGRAVSREDLLREVWGYRGRVRSRTVDNTVARLRGKIEENPAEPRHIITVHGTGYRFER